MNINKHSNDYRTLDWYQNYNLLVDYYNKYKNVDVPYEYVINTHKLGVWVKYQRQSYKNGNDHCSTRQDEDKHTGNSHIHYMLTGEDEKTIKTDKSGKTDIVKQVEWPE